MKVAVEISCGQGRICVDWNATSRDEWGEALRLVKTIDGRSFVTTPRRHWHVPQDMMTCRRLRQVFGEDLDIGPNLFSWAQQASREEASLGSLALAESGTLHKLWDQLPGLAAAIHVGPIGLTFTTDEQWEEALRGPGSFQAADVEFLLNSPAPINANQQGLGKTPEWIAAVWEGGWAHGNHLVVCPSAAVDGTWESELEKWHADAKEPIGIFCCTGTKAQREETLRAWQASTAKVKWVVVNPQMIQLRKDPTRTSNTVIMIPPGLKAARGACRCEDRKPHEHYFQAYPELDINWTTYCIDECHKGSIRNHKTITAKSLMAVSTEKRACMSGTPSKKYGQDLWGLLSWLRPDVFTSSWRFWGQFFEIDDSNPFGKKVLGLRDDRKEEFFLAMKPFMLRRTKAECLPWLPPKMFVNVWCHMGARQNAQYQSMLKEGFTRMGSDGAQGEVELFVNSTLAEFTRLGQFANAVCELREGKVIPTEESCKLDAMLAKMDEGGMFEEGATTKQIVFSQSREMVELVARLLRERGLSVDIISGKQHKKGERRKIREAFQEGPTRVLCIVTTAGGVSLTLDAADVAHFVDESWAPDDSEQAEDRLHRASRVHQVTIYNYRTKDSIDEYRMDTAFGKAEAQKFILDVRRKLMKEAV